MLVSATAVSDAEAGSLTEATFGSYTRKQIVMADWTLKVLAQDQQTIKTPTTLSFQRPQERQIQSHMHLLQTQQGWEHGTVCWCVRCFKNNCYR